MNQLLRFDPGSQSSQCVTVNNGYGVAANILGEIWNTRYTDNRSSKLSDAGGLLLTTASTDPNAIWYRGVVVTPDDNDAWTAATGDDAHHIPPFTVTRHSNSGVLRKIIDLYPWGGYEPTGVAVDSRGFVWVTNKASHNVMRINPNAGADGLGEVDLVVPLGAGAYPYNYSDMTGVNLYHTISPAGVWTIVRDGGNPDTAWQSIYWTSDAGTGNVTVQARAANDAHDLGKQLYVGVTSGQCLDEILTGRYVQVRVQLNAYCHDADSPVLDNLHVCKNASDCPSKNDCDDDGILDVCDDTPVLIALRSSDPVGSAYLSDDPGDTLWRSSHNIVRLTFACPLTVPEVGDLLIQEMLPDRTFGTNLAVEGNFSFTVENQSVLRIWDNDSNLAHRKWYAYRNTGDWSGVADFEVQYQVQAGDATKDDRVLQSDVGFISSEVPCTSNCGDARRSDIDGNLLILQADAGIAASNVPSLPVSKPSGHGEP